MSGQETSRPELLSKQLKTQSIRNTAIMSSQSDEEIARYLGVVQETVYRWTRRKGLPAHRVGKLWKFKTDEVDHWVKSGSAQDKGEKAR